MSDYNREKEIHELKALRAELLSQYEDIQKESKLSLEESVLLRQTLLDNYGEDNFNRYIDNDDSNNSNESETFVKRLKQGRSM